MSKRGDVSIYTRECGTQIKSLPKRGDVSTGGSECGIALEARVDGVHKVASYWARIRRDIVV